MAIRSGIPVREWMGEDDPRILDTALALLIEENRETERQARRRA